MPRYCFPALINAVALPAIAAPAAITPTAAAFDPLQTALEKSFPHILLAIQTMWGYRELNLYLNKLTIDDRGDREGFPKEVWEELYLVMRLHHDVFPEFKF